MMLSMIGGAQGDVGEGDAAFRKGAYSLRDWAIESDWDAHDYLTALRAMSGHCCGGLVGDGACKYRDQIVNGEPTRRSPGY